MDQDIYVSEGFSPDRINRIPEDGSWKKIPKGEAGRMRLSIPELKISGLPERKSFSLQTYRPRLVTILIPFRFDLTGEESIYGLFFAYIGGCWEIYLNGRMIKSEFHLDEKGDIDYTTNSRNILIPVHSNILRKGENILAIKILGDPTFVKTGIYQNRPNVLADINSIYDLHTETVSLILIFIYLVIGFYHLFFFALRRSEKYNLYFALTCFALFINQFARTSWIYNIINDSYVINRLELVFLYTLLPLLGFFLESVLFGKIRKFTYIYSLIFLVLIIITVFAPMPFTYDIVQVWEKFMAVPVLCYMVYILVADFVKSINSFNPRFSRDSAGVPEKVFQGLLFTISGRFLFGLVIIVLCVVLDIVLKRYYYINVNPTRYGFLLMVIGITFNLSDNLLYIYRRAESLNVSLNEKISDLKTAYEKISVSEEKYRMLIEGVNHYICTTDLAGNILTANNKFMNDHRLEPDSVGRANILDMFYIPEDDKGVTRMFISEKIAEAVKEKKQVSFKAMMKPYYQIEPREMNVHFEIVNIEGAQEILIKAYDTIEDSLLKNMVCEKQVLEMGNSLSVAEEISNRLVRNIERYYDPRKINILRIALREMILNSIEHGNLDITYNIKTEAIDNERYFEFIAERQKDPRFRDKKISIEYTLTPRKVIYVIRDDGNGFDHNYMINNALTNANDLLLSHGRGIAMTINAFDKVIYNEKGNEVKLVKYFNE